MEIDTVYHGYENCRSMILRTNRSFSLPIAAQELH